MATTKPYKAVAAFVLAFLTALFAALQGREDLDTLGGMAWFVIILGAVVTAGGVWAVSNPPTNT